MTAMTAAASTEPTPRPLGHGPLRADLLGAALDRVRFAGTPVLRRVYVGVRDRDWRTVPAQVLGVESEGGDRVTVHVRHDNGDVGFRWTGTISLTDRELTFEMDGQAERDFLRSRVGLCLLHPLRLAGTPVLVRGPDGEHTGRFPERISPHQPLRDIVAMRYHDGGLEVSIELDGDVFETEDQRNWTDASYKTYGTPLSLPFPVRLRRGRRVRQRMRLSVTGRPAPARTPARGPAGVRLGADGPPLPAIGLQHRGPVPAESRALAEAGPAFVHADVRMDLDGWREHVAEAGEVARGLGVPLRVGAVRATPGQVAELAGTPMDTLLLFGPRLTTTRELAEAARRVFAGTGLRIGGGSRAHFAELNRADGLPVDLLDLVCFPITATAHADDTASVRETLRVHPRVVAQARELAGGRPVLVGPVSLRPAWDPWAPDAPPPPPDPRHRGPFGAAWTVGALAALGLAGAAEISLYETTGPRGVVGAPVWHVLAALRPYAGGRLVRLDLPDGLTGLAVRKDARHLIIVANPSDEPRALDPGGRDWELLAESPLADGVRPARDGPLVLPGPSVAFSPPTTRTRQERTPDA
ncbi:hypothetical protein Airi01_035340 [Actinoallomurus iriomotensis]|uniref:Uncharacterized protein n=2 Tax=Actinoallomurus iriomotensis TaxID=478107 RepID=A0A9W6RJN1_9ACTN|nr:hypothetical protein Airi01_035340 [Actinoallomurus iriomotensis]